MTTPRDAIGLSERLRVMGAAMPTCDEAATALDALQARVKELERESDGYKRLYNDEVVERLRAEKQRDAAEARATSAEQQRDEAYERAAEVAEQHAWSHPSAGLLGPEMNSMEIAAAIRRLAAGTEKEKRE